MLAPEPGSTAYWQPNILQTELQMDVGALGALLDQSHDAIFAWEHGGGIVVWNHSAELMYGYPAEQALNRDPKELLKTVQLSPAPHFVSSLEQTGSWEGELEHTSREGRRIIVDSWMRMVNVGGRECVLESNRDITCRKESEMLLRRDNARLRILSTIAEALLAARNPDELMQDVYQQLARDLQLDGYIHYAASEQKEQLELKSSAGIPIEAVPCLQKVEFGDAICGAVALTREPLLANDIQNSDHPRLKAVRLLGFQTYACYPLLNGDELLGTFSLASRQKQRFDQEDIDFVRTVTRYVVLATVRLRNEVALQRKEEQLRAAKDELEAYTRSLECRVEERTASLQHTVRSLEDLLYTIAHDLRAPNRALSGFAEILLREHSDGLAPEAIELLERISTAAIRNDQLIRDVLELGQLAQREVTCRELSLGRVVRRTVDAMQTELTEANARVELDREWPEVWANDSVLREILMQLLSNALKYVPKDRPPEIRIWAQCENGDVRICVQDNGIGIAPGHQEIIFQPFQRLNPESNPHGTGIGLAIVQQGAKRLGGSAGVTSDGPGSGSCFWVKLRKAARHPAPAAFATSF